MSKKVFIIAEAGVNHNGSLELAKELIDIAIFAGASAVKFQTFIPDEVILKGTPKCAYQASNTGSNDSQYDLIKNLQLTFDQTKSLFDYGHQKGICIISTPFDLQSLIFLDNINSPIIKIASGEITNYPLLFAAAKTNRPIIISSGMATIGDIEFALEVLAFGYLNQVNDYWPSLNDVRRTYCSTEGQNVLKEKVTILHCTTNYPALPEQLNLKVIETLSKTFGLKVGYSDHSLGINAAIAAVSLGATVIEKHFTSSKALSGPDHKASLDPSELKQLVDSIRETELMMGNGNKIPFPIEIETASLVRRSIVANQPIEEGDIFTLSNLSLKRPGNHLQGHLIWEILGKRSPKKFSKDDFISF